ncbi:hypothetical protein EIP86_008923 [Pleurotus ostreatoroseus]|nr:hypothetical protein EIP86_008923 [Pleurotus ostreatoroseus]
MATPHMPMRTERSAPTFDPTNPRELRRYFEDLEALLQRCNITDATEKKRYARNYVPVDVADQWEMIPEYSSQQATYDQFKDKIFEQYPNAKDSKRWTRQNVFDLVNNTFTKGIYTLDDWAQFYREYLAMSAYLITKGKYSKDEQGRKVLSALKPDLLNRVYLRLQIKVPTHEADAAYELKDINEAVTWVLQGGGTLGGAAPTTISPPSTSTTSPPQDSSTVKQEDFKALIDTFAKIADSLARTATAQQQAIAAPRPRIGASFCHYCGKDGHTVSLCPTAEEDIKQGLLRRNPEGKLITPSGSWIPRSLPGEFIRDRLLSWHTANPNNVAKGNLTYSTNLLTLSTPSSTSQSPSNVDDVYQREIQMLEQAIAGLRNARGRFYGVEVPQRAKGKNDNIAKNDKPPAQPTEAPKAQEKAPQPTPAPTQDQPNSHDPSPLHPFEHARDATYIPPAERNYHQAPKNPMFQRNRAPIESDKLTDHVFDRLMQRTSLQVTPEELLAVSPDLRAKMRVSVTAKRSHRIYGRRCASQLRPSGLTGSTGEDAPAMALEDFQEYHLPDPDTLREQAASGNHGAINIPYDIYLKDFAKYEDGTKITVAQESESLRTLLAKVQGRGFIECILDPGCQIVAMSEAAAHRLGVSYDPQNVLQMQSANGQLNQSLGIASNVPFEFDGIVLYFQVHIIREAAYDVLLGRPFDEVAKSIVTTLPGGKQTVTIQCPNTHQIITLPTYARGASPLAQGTASGFSPSRIRS